MQFVDNATEASILRIFNFAYAVGPTHHSLLKTDFFSTKELQLQLRKY